MLEGGSAQIVANLLMLMERSPHNERIRFRTAVIVSMASSPLHVFCKSLYILVVVVVLK